MAGVDLYPYWGFVYYRFPSDLLVHRNYPVVSLFVGLDFLGQPALHQGWPKNTGSTSYRSRPYNRLGLSTETSEFNYAGELVDGDHSFFGDDKGDRGLAISGKKDRSGRGDRFGLWDRLSLLSFTLARSGRDLTGPAGQRGIVRRKLAPED